MVRVSKDRSDKITIKKIPLKVEPFKVADKKDPSGKRKRSKNTISFNIQVSKEYLHPLLKHIRGRNAEFLIDSIEEAIEREALPKNRGIKSDISEDRMFQMKVASARIYSFILYCRNVEEKLRKYKQYRDCSLRELDDLSAIEEYRQSLDLVPLSAENKPKEITYHLIKILFPEAFPKDIKIESFYNKYILPYLDADSKKEEKKKKGKFKYRRSRCPKTLRDFLMKRKVEERLKQSESPKGIGHELDSVVRSFMRKHRRKDYRSVTMALYENNPDFKDLMERYIQESKKRRK